ncbi:hypothetical protein CH268_09315 [Rhodococcus sp. 06-1460-1B]|nr:hypothetical protein CH268_09315 [Rhodococcus sp. 06-1460-1B]
MASGAIKNAASSEGRRNVQSIRQFKNTHVGERCVIIGNGPSLNNTDMSLLKNETTFGLNRIYLMFEKMGFETTYNVVVNQLVVEQCVPEFESLSSPLFTTQPSRRHLRDVGGNIHFMNKVAGPRFSKDVSHGLWEGATVTFVAMQLAYYMGFSQVILVGVDHSFTSKGVAHKTVESEGDDPNHFDPNYFGKGFRWQLPDLERSEVAYILARLNFQLDSRTIVDSTVGGKLDIFPKIPLEEALRER